MKFGEYLVLKKLLSSDELMEALGMQECLPAKLGRLVRDLKMIEQSDLNLALKEFLKIEKLKSAVTLIEDFKEKNIQPQLVGNAIKVEDERGVSFYFGKFCDELLENAEKENKKINEIYMIDKSQWLAIIKSFFSDSEEEAVRETLKENEYAYKTMFLDLLERAKTEKASDIHIEPKEDELLIRFRIIGELTTIKTLDFSHRDGFLSEAKRLSGLPLVVTGKDGDGEAVFPALNVKVRSNILPTKFGSGLCLRVNDMDKAGELRIDKMGLSIDAVNAFKKSIGFKNGVVLISGPTGSGKSSTVYSLVMEMDRSKKKIITLEDPIEHESSDMLQVPIVKDRITFNSGLRAILRHDPDAIIVGEIRDEETAQICFKAAATGHLVISTIHTNDAMNVVSRLRMLGITDDILKENLRLCVAQTLLKRLCGNCSQKTEDIPLKDGTSFMKANSEGCNVEDCIGGYSRKRQLVVQMVNQKQITQFLDSEDVDNYRTLKEMALEYAQKGVISYEDAMSVA